MSQPQHNKWPTGLCDCFSDCSTCCYGFWCLPCQFGDNAEKMGDGPCILNCCLYHLLMFFCLDCCLAAPKRGRLRANHNLREEPCGDCCTHCWCGCCAVCQEARLIKRYGVAPTIQSYQQAAPMVPPPQQAFLPTQVAPHQVAGHPPQQFMVV